MIKIKKKNTYGRDIMKKLVGITCRYCGYGAYDVVDLMKHEGIHNIFRGTSFASPIGLPSNLSTKIQATGTTHLYGQSIFFPKASGTFSH